MGNFATRDGSLTLDSAMLSDSSKLRLRWGFTRYGVWRVHLGMLTLKHSQFMKHNQFVFDFDEPYNQCIYNFFPGRKSKAWQGCFKPMFCQTWTGLKWLLFYLKLRVQHTGIRDATHVWGKNRKTGNKYSCHQLPFPSYPNLFRPTSPQLSLIATNGA